MTYVKRMSLPAKYSSTVHNSNLNSSAAWIVARTGISTNTRVYLSAVYNYQL